ncbi:rhomboid family intramembrane serine protease [uncultured Roseobacter sp.]|uniref:rhomboid family intramembrane serine protease n=1 Tax=uncultured Roseobacter sp. TaxID=114847 RepID=UPI00262256AF|nr:rhomboid family intramembrane serine protease [uncultured Roseobacter sp.]
MTTPAPSEPSSPADLPERPWILIAVIALCSVIELVLQLADWQVLNAPRLRLIAYEYGGFWVGLLQSWVPNYPSQPYLMFLTYGFLHGGLLHLVINMATLWSLGLAVLDRVGLKGFVMLYCAALLGGATGFALLASTTAPMVGASGALFGLAGGLLAWGYVDRFTLQEALWPVARAAGLLLTLNVVMWWALDGQLAWETHLGGFVSGWLAAMVIDPRPRQ